MHSYFYSVINGYVAGCHSTCSCRDTGFNPVCGDDKVVYYSACHAGCTVPPDKPMVCTISYFSAPITKLVRLMFIVSLLRCPL